jgi:hypothetical protein
MKRMIKWVSLGIGVYLAALIITMPATVAWQLAGDRVPARLVAPKGTVFSGSAQSIAWPEGGRIDGVRWSFQPVGLLTGAAAMRIEGQLRGSPLAGTVRYRPWPGMQLRNAQFDGPLDELLITLRHEPAAEMVEGELSVDLEAFTMAGNRLAGASGVMTWRNARAGFGGTRFAFGELTLRLKPDQAGQGATGKISSRGGEIDISGDLELDADRDFQLVTRIGGDGPPNDATRQLRTLLGLSGDGNGRIQVSGNWRDNQFTLEQVERD